MITCSFAWNNDLFVLYPFRLYSRAINRFILQRALCDSFTRKVLPWTFLWNGRECTRPCPHHPLNKFITSILWSAKMAKVSWISCNCSSVEMFVDCIVAMIRIASLKSSKPFRLPFRFCFNSFFGAGKIELDSEKLFVSFNDRKHCQYQWMMIISELFPTYLQTQTQTIMCFCRAFNVFSVFSIKISPRVFFQSTAYARMLSISERRLSLIGPMSWNVCIVSMRSTMFVYNKNFSSIWTSGKPRLTNFSQTIILSDVHNVSNSFQLCMQMRENVDNQYLGIKLHQFQRFCI